MIKAIFFDIDGTLVEFGARKISDSVICALQKLREKGVKLFISTGRPKSYIEISDFGFEFDGIVAMNGQYCSVNDRVIYENYLDSEETFRMMSHANEEGISCAVMEADYTYMNFFSSDWSYCPVDDIQRILEHKTYQISPNVPKEEALHLLEHFTDIKITYWNPDFFDIMPANGGKQVGIRHMLEYFGIEAAESMAFGDSNNDVEMLKAVGISVAMGNANDETKSVADYVCGDVKDDGIVDGLKHFGLI